MPHRSRTCRPLSWRAVPLFLALGALCVLAACGTTVAQSRLDAANPALAPARGSAARASSLAVMARAYLARMSLDDKLGQLFLLELVGPEYAGDNAVMVEQYHPGGILVYNREMPNFQAAHSLLAAAQAHASLPLFTVVDEEGGFVDRLSDIYGFRPSASMIGATGSPDFARAQGVQVAKDMEAVGLNLDLAPDVDVQLVDGPDQSTRTFGTTPDSVTQLAGAWLDGLQGQGAIGCLKHFPGLGAATSDAHLGLPMIYRSRDQIEQVELAPYRALIQRGTVGCVMSTDLLMPALDANLPAEISPAIINGVLRGELGYDGVVVTDALYMQGVADRFAMPQAGVMAIQAGCDFLMGPWSSWQTRDMIAALKGALASGALTIGRINQSVLRLLTLKLRDGILPHIAVRLKVGPVALAAPVTGGAPLEADLRRAL
jgi:beta-N-acetylhexosaminidase